jgi:hypothetical protein
VNLLRLKLILLILFMAATVAEAGPFAAFFSTLKRGFAHSNRQVSAHRVHGKKIEPAASHDLSGNQASDKSTNGPPNDRNTQAAMRVAGKKDRDLGYGIPVPGRSGLVISPFAPDSGYIDVRGFPPGTAVKDPYTGKVFLTP